MACPKLGRLGECSEATVDLGTLLWARPFHRRGCVERMDEHDVLAGDGDDFRLPGGLERQPGVRTTRHLLDPG